MKSNGYYSLLLVFVFGVALLIGRMLAADHHPTQFALPGGSCVAVVSTPFTAVITEVHCSTEAVK